jgi:Ni/Fe-hydrogenase 1 B-type cytochrome subunit
MTQISDLKGALDARGELAAFRQTVYVYETPVRIWHWINALAITVLCVTGYLIGSPPHSVPGEASASFLMGYIRFFHFASGYVVAAGLLGRLYWAFVGNRYARQIFWPPVWDRLWRWGFLYELKWYFFLVRDPKKYIGHNPLGHAAMSSFVLVLIFMICSGFALYSQGAGADSWQAKMFGWIFWIWPNSQDVHTWHHLGMWSIVIFALIHVYAAVREDVLSRQSMISSIVSGERVFRDDFRD